MSIKNDLLATASSIAVSAISNAGGEGKTTISIVVEAALDLLGRSPQLVDIDQGMGSLAFQRDQAKSLDWGMSDLKADAVFERLRGADVIFDFGANTLASGAPVVRLYGKVSDALAAIGFRRVALVPISTNKPGAVGAAKDIIRAFSHVECYAVLVNRDGSDRYDEDISGISALTMPHLDPVFQAVRTNLQQEGISLADALRSPPVGWVHATDYLGMWLRAFATQPAMIDILGGDVGPVLNALGRRNRPALRLRGLAVEDLHDDAIGDRLRLSAFGSLIQKTGLWRVLDTHGLTPAGLRAAADELERGESA
jgi:hypothetical protein